MWHLEKIFCIERATTDKFKKVMLSNRLRYTTDAGFLDSVLKLFGPPCSSFFMEWKLFSVFIRP